MNLPLFSRVSSKHLFSGGRLLILTCCKQRIILHKNAVSSSLSVQKRLFSESTSWFPQQVIHSVEGVLDNVHSYTHLPWWMVITLTTFTLRTIITLPLAVHQNKIIAKMELLKPTIQEYQEAIKHNVIVKCRRANLPVEEANRILMKEAKKVTRELLNSEGCNPYKVAILPWVQIPLWITISFAIRNMSGVFPGMSPLNPDIFVSLATEGTLWFKDLTLTDPYFILPFLLVFTNFLNIELHAIRRQAPTRLQRVMTNSFRVLTFGMGYVSAQMPAAMVLYWSLSSTYGLTQNILFKYPQVRRLLGIPKTPSESKTPYRDLMAVIKEKARYFVMLQQSNRKQ